MQPLLSNETPIHVATRVDKVILMQHVGVLNRLRITTELRHNRERILFR